MAFKSYVELEKHTFQVVSDLTPEDLLFELANGELKVRPSQDLAAALVAKTDLRHLKIFLKTTQYFIYIDELGIHIPLDKEELKLIIFRIVQGSAGIHLAANMLDKVANDIRFTEISNFGKPEISKNHFVLDNGVFNIKTRKFEEFSSKIFATSKALYKYDPTASDMPEFHKFLNHISEGHEDRKKYIRAMMFTVLFSRTDFQVMFFLQGPGGTGKSSFAQILVYLVGPEVTKTTTYKALNSEQFGIFNFIARKLILINDSGQFIKNLDVIKAFVSGNSFQGTEMYQTHTTDVFKKGIIVTVSNSEFEEADTGDSVSRYLRLLPFHKQVAPKNKKVLIKAKTSDLWTGPIVSEAPAIFNWIVGTTEDDIDHITHHKERVASLNDFNLRAFLKLNPVRTWVSECIEPYQGYTFLGKNKVDPYTGEISLENLYLYPVYVRWCKLNGLKNILSINTFSNKFLEACKSLGINTRKSRRAQGTIFHNVRVIKQFNQLSYQIGGPEKGPEDDLKH